MAVSATELLAGDALHLARAISQVERQDAAAEALLAELFPRSGKGQIVGITGPPGCGKSSLLSALADHLSNHGHKVGILAIDPTSDLTGGAFLGDRVRMTGLGKASNVYIRSLATRGATGTLSEVAWDAVTVLDALGYDPIFVETVGAGQNEFELRTLVHTTVLVDAPGLGDSIQTLKAGLLEICDIVVINKGDRPGSHLAAQQVQQMLQMGPPSQEEVWTVQVLTTEALNGVGVPNLWDQIRGHFLYLNQTGRRQEIDDSRVAHRVDHLVQRRWAELLPKYIAPEQRSLVLEKVKQQQLDPHGAARALFELLTPPASIQD